MRVRVGQPFRIRIYEKSKVVYDSICSFEHELLQLRAQREKVEEKKATKLIEKKINKTKLNKQMCFCDCVCVCVYAKQHEICAKICSKLISQRGN